MILTDILKNYPCREISHIWEEYRGFFVDQADPIDGGFTSVEIFKFFPVTGIFEISGDTYDSGDHTVPELISQRFRELHDPELDYEELRAKYSGLNELQSAGSAIQFDESCELNKLQVRNYEAGYDPSQLEHFTDWLADYLPRTQIWQVRYPAEIYEISCVDQKINFEPSEDAVIEEKLFRFGETGLVEDGHWIRLRLTRFTEDGEDGSVCTINDEYDECELFFHDGEASVDPSDADLFDLWYSHLVLGNDPFDDDDDDDMTVD